MGRRGPKKTPTKVLKLRGSWRGKKRPAERTGAYKRPAMPQFLTGDARREWIRILPILEKMGVLAEVDRTMLALYCKCYAEWREADDLVKSLLIKTTGGNIIQHPALSIRTAAWERLRKICAEFGLSPSSRTGLAVTPKSRDTADKSRFFEKNKNAYPRRTRRDTKDE